MRGLMRLSGAASDMPVQMQEVLDDLRKGSLKLQVSELSLREAADQLGRRVFSGLMVSALLLAGAILIGTGQPIVGAIAILAAAFWTASHLGLLFVLKRWGKRKPP